MAKKKQQSKHASLEHDDHAFSSHSIGDESPTNSTRDMHVDESSATSSVPKKQQRAHTQKMEKELTEIYQNGDGTLPDMTSFEKGKGRHMVRSVLTLVCSLAFLSGALWYGYTTWNAQKGDFVEDDVILSIGGDEEVSYGQEVWYRVRFKNAQSIPLDTATIEVRYPAGFVFTTSTMSPDAETNNVWTLGRLAEQDGEFIDIGGRLYGNVGDAQSFRVFLTYTPSNFSSVFQKVATQETAITAAPVTLSIDAPKEIPQGKAVTFSLTLTPDMTEIDQLPRHLALVFDPGVPFVLQNMEPESSEFVTRSWAIDSLDSEQIFTITGAFAGGESPVTTTASLIGWQDGQPRSDAYTIATIAQEIALAERGLSVTLAANGSQQDITVQPGEDVHTTVVVQNTSEKKLDNVRIRLMFDAPSANKRSIMDWAAIDDSADGSIVGEQLSDSVRRGQITWDAETVPALRSLDPGEQVSIDVSLPVKSAEQTDLAAYTTYDITLASDVQYDAAGGKETAAAIPLLLTINSDTTFDVRDEIDEDTHTITWVLSNTFHPLADVEAAVDVYGKVSIDPDIATVPAGEISYDSDAQRLVWRIDAMPLSVDVLALQFPVTLNAKNPSQSQLTSKVTVTATDTVTGKQILLIGDEVGL